LRQTLSRILFQRPEKLAELLPTDINLKQLRQSFLDEIITLELDSQNAQQIFTWIKQNLNIFTLTIVNTEPIHLNQIKPDSLFYFQCFLKSSLMP
jgi:hypothetical protein